MTDQIEHTHLKQIAVALVVIAVSVALCACAVLGVTYLADNSCVYYSGDDPFDASVEFSNGIFTSSGPMYTLRYHGKRKLSGNDCVANVRVSERQYDDAIAAAKGTTE